MTDKNQVVVGKDAVVSLREVTGETVVPVCRLKVSKEQENLVAPNSVSIAQAYFNEKAWFRAIYADETPVGFVMLFDSPEEAEYYLWRFMIAEEHQGKGFGARALQLIIDHVKTRPNAKELTLSYVPEERGPEHFYKKFGFAPNGKIEGGEVGMTLAL